MPRIRVRRFAATLSLFALGCASVPAFAEQVAVPAPSSAPLVESHDDWGPYGVQTQWIDARARPGDDFDRYANGRWNDTIQIAADKTRIGAFMSLRDLSEDRVKAILDELTAKPQVLGSAEARVADAYRAFMDTGAIEAAGLAPAKPWLDRIAAVKDRTQLVSLFATPGFASPIGAFVDADEKQSDVYALYMGQGALGLPDRDYYLLDTERYRTIRAKYLEHLAFLLGKAGHADPQGTAKAVLALETDMARAKWDRTAGRNRDLTYNKLTVAEAEALAPSGMVRTFLGTMGTGNVGSVIVAQVPPTAEELAAAKITPAEAAEKLSGGVPATFRLIAERPVATWQAWLVTQFLKDNAQFLPREIDDANFAFFGTVLNGQPQQRPRWKRGIAAVEGQVGELLGQIYAKRHFPPANKAAMADLVGNLRKAMSANLAELSWMGTATRKEAEAKLAAFTPKIGEPDAYKTYDGLAISAGAPLANQMAAAKWISDFQVARLGKPVDRGEWGMLPQTVNAYYNPVFNEIVFPAAILQPPFFNLSADPAVNYGAIGAVIGHEMGHGFDDQGAKSDGQGNLRDWWTAQDKANFEALQDKLVKQYDAFCPFDEASKGGKACVNGRFTLGENIGDLGGLSLAYRAYRLSLGGQAPVIDGTTGDQRFFLAWAQVWRGKARDEIARQYLVTDPHSPPKYRINGIVRNFEEWYRAFGVKPGDALYLPPEERVRIW